MRFLVVLVLILLAGCGLRSESDLREQFQKHRDAVTKILEMQRQDSKVIRIAPSFTWLENDVNWPRKEIGISQERWETYRNLFTEAGIDAGTVMNKDGIWFLVSGEGLAIGGTSRGFVYTVVAPDSVMTSLDECPKSEGICYVSIEGAWYIFQWVS